MCLLFFFVSLPATIHPFFCMHYYYSFHSTCTFFYCQMNALQQQQSMMDGVEGGISFIWAFKSTTIAQLNDDLHLFGKEKKVSKPLIKISFFFVKRELLATPKCKKNYRHMQCGIFFRNFSSHLQRNLSWLLNQLNSTCVCNVCMRLPHSFATLHAILPKIYSLKKCWVPVCCTF